MDPVNVAATCMDARNTPAKFEVRSFTRSWDNRGYSKNLGSPWIHPRSLFSNILIGLCSDGPCECIGQICSPYSFSRSWDSDCSFGMGLRTPNLGKEEAVGGRGWYRSKEYFSSIITRFRDIAAFVFHHATFSHPTSSLPEISPCSPGIRWRAFGPQRAKVLR